ncbi:MAG: DUF933 domain-containing protein [Thermodesulfobacteriota bacterium]
MKIGMIGLSGSGKTTLFSALTRQITDSIQKGEDRIGTIPVPDPRVRDLARIFNPKKIIYCQVTYLLPASTLHRPEHPGDPVSGSLIKEGDALIHVIRNFKAAGMGNPTPLPDFLKLDQEMMLNDLMVVEKRLERILLDRKRGKKMDEEEFTALSSSAELLEKGIPLRRHLELTQKPSLRGYPLMSAKPMLVLFNNADDDEAPPKMEEGPFFEEQMVIRGRLEQELSQMNESDAELFAREFQIHDFAMERVIKKSFSLLGLITFFTVLSSEVRAWTIPQGSTAQDAAGAIHSDMKKGFIRAEVLNHQELINAGSYAEAKKRGIVRLEGKTYLVSDGDILQIRFNVTTVKDK